MKKLKRLLLILFVFVAAAASGQEASNDNLKKWTLEDCIEHALENNLTVKRNIYFVESNEISRVQSLWSMSPSLNFGGSYGNSWGRTIDPTTNLFTTDRFQSLGMGLNSSWQLFQTNARRNTYKQASIDLEVSKYDLEASKDGVILNVITFFTAVVFTKEQYQNALSQLSSTRQLAEQTRLRLEAGAVAQRQLLDLLAQQATNEVTVINAENDYNLSLLILKQELQIPSNEPFEIEIPEIDINEEGLVLQNIEDIFDLAYNTFPTIRSADLGIESADLGVKIARARLYPSLTLNANINTNYSSVRDAQRRVFNGSTITLPAAPIGTVNLDPTQIVYTNPIDVPGTDSFENYPVKDQFSDNITRSLNLSFNIPILNGLSANSNVQQSIIQQKQAEIILEERSNILRQNIERAYNDVIAARKSYDQSLTQVEFQEEAYRATQRSYELGAANFTDFQVSQNNLFVANTNLLLSKYDFIFKFEILQFYKGEIDYY